MSRHKGGSRRLWWLPLMVVVMTVFPAKAAGNPRWGTGGALLITGDEPGIEGQSFTPWISSGGNFVVSLSDTYEPMQYSPEVHVYSSSRLDVWDTRTFDLGSVLTRPVPITSLDVSVADFPPDFVVSPDEQYVAVQADGELRVLSLPQLALYRAIPAPDRTNYSRVLDWSSDGRFVGALFGSEMLVFDQETNAVYRHDIGYVPAPDENWHHPSLRHMNNGWLLNIMDASRFLHCDWRLQACKSYEFEDLWYVEGSPDGAVILAKRHTRPISDGSVGVWVWDGEGTYALRDESLSAEIEPEAFSPTGQYLTVRREGDQRVIFDYISLTPVYTLPLPRPYPTLPAWLPGDEHFVTLTASFQLGLYRIGQDEPVETLDVRSIYPSVDFRNLTLWEDVTVSVDAGGRWVLIGLSRAALAVPLRYE